VCVYSTDWRLGNEVGRQVLLARSGSAAPLEITAISRRRPSLRLGLATAFRRGDVSVVENTRLGDTVRVRREIPGGFVEYDSVPRERTVETTTGGWRPEAMPLILLDGPPVLRWEWLRLSVGASAINFKRDFFAGIALLQLRNGVQAEDSGFDFQFGALFSRPERLGNPELCSRDLLENRPEDVIKVSCKTRDEMRFDGVAVTVSTDALRFQFLRHCRKNPPPVLGPPVGEVLCDEPSAEPPVRHCQGPVGDLRHMLASVADQRPQIPQERLVLHRRPPPGGYDPTHRAITSSGTFTLSRTEEPYESPSSARSRTTERRWSGPTAATATSWAASSRA
jgi:hypothetical protein